MFPSFENAKNLFSKYGIDLTEIQFEKLKIYAEFLVEYNQNVNLTAITDGEQILVKHFLDSVLLNKYAEIPRGASLIDVGTGAGFPSIPLKIFRDDIEITLLDSLNKRINFLEMLCDKLEIKSNFVHGRAEDYGKNPIFREKFDVSCARAVANLGVLTELCLPFVKVGGQFLSMKGPTEDIKSGENAIELLGGTVKNDLVYDLEGNFRKLVVIEKISQTPTKYPRNSSQIKKKAI